MPRWQVVNHKYLRMATTVISVMLALTLGARLHAQGPALTTVSDTVYRADGTAALGTVLISWPTFQTVEGDAVAAGNLAVSLGTGGSFTAQLVPNVGATPAGTYYVVVFQLDDGTVRTEYWAVPQTSPTTIAGVLTTPGTGLGNLAVTQGFVDSAVAAENATVVHLAGAETITGTKQFTAPPSLPTPVGATDAANKSYVDTAVSNVGSGAYVAIAGGTMTGPLTLPADPTAPSQAADRHYVDNGLAAKADLVNGTIPTGELGGGVASSATCLNGNSTWGSCGGGAPAGISYATTALNWTQTISSSLTGGTQASVTLTPCPVGIDTTSGAGYQVFLSGSGNTEAVNVVTAPGGCISGAASGAITFTPFYSYAAGYTISSASGGVQETINAACGTSANYAQNGQCNVTLPANNYGAIANNYVFNGTVFLHGFQSTLSGYGATISCRGRGPCIQVGNLTNANNYPSITIQGISFRTDGGQNSTNNSAYAGVNIINTVTASGVQTITTATAHGFRIGDMVTILFTDDSRYWGDCIVQSVPTSTTFTCRGSGNIASQGTPGVVALAFVAVLDNANNTHLADLSYDLVGETARFNNFFDFWDDENATVEHFENNAIPLNRGATWTGSFFFSGGAAHLSQQLAPVITVRDSAITANLSNCATILNSNGFYFDNTVCQASGLWEVKSSNERGNYQGAEISNIYSEAAVSDNPISPAYTPFPGTGIAGAIFGSGTGATRFAIHGGSGMAGGFASGGTGPTPYNYYIVVHDCPTTYNCTTSPNQASVSSPLPILLWMSTGSDSIPIRWPRVANGTDVITYDIVRSSGTPSNGNCTGGSGGACGSVVTNLSQATACSGGLVCTYTDSGSATTSNYPYPANAGNYVGNLHFWPGALVVVGTGSLSTPVDVDSDQSPSVGVGLSYSPIQTVKRCGVAPGVSAGGYDICLASTATSGLPNQTATLLTDGYPGQSMTLSKGRLNLLNVGWAIYPHHIITLLDSNPTLTETTGGYRPPASANDVWIGTDVAGGASLSSGQLAFGAPVAITNYIAQVGDGVHANWLERLSASLKEFNVPAKFDQTVTLAGLANGCLNIASGVIGSTGAACGSGGGGGGGGVSSVFGRSGVIVAASGDYTVSQVTGAAADAAVVHNTGNETIAGAKSFTNNVTFNSNLVLPQGFGYVPAVGGIGLDMTAGMPVVNIAGTTEQLALTSSNISGQAGTALALAATPTQCSGSFAVGIAANGNANCTTPDVVQLSETAQPSGIPGWGVFWFDSTTHTPRVIDNNGQVTQLGLANLFNSDPGGDASDNLEERNGGTPENLRVYSSYSNGTAWQRMSLGFDAADNPPVGYAVLRSENSTSASAPGLGFWIGSGLKWVVDPTGTFKPWTDNQFNLGSDSGNAAKSVYAKTSFNSVVYGRNDFEIPNDTGTGTVLNKLAVFNGNNPLQSLLAPTSASNGVIGLVQGGAGNSGNAVVTWRGYGYCIFDGTTTAGDAVVASTTTAGDCHDTGSMGQPGVQLIGYVDVSNSTSGQTNGIRVNLQAPQGSGGGGSVASVFGRTGSVTAASGDYSVAQVTGAAVDSAVVHLAGTETISGSKTFSSDVTLSGNLNVAGNINQTSTGPTQWSGKEWTGTTVTVPGGMDFSLGVGSDNTFRCQLAGGASCMAASVAPSTTVNGHALSSNVTVSASDLTTGTLPAAQLPAATCSWITAPTQSGSGNAFSGTNKAIVWGVYNPYPCVTNNVAYVVGTVDNTSNNYALGLYSGASGGAGTLIATTASTAGTTFASSTGIHHIGWNASNVTVPAGRIYIALTSNCASSCAALLGTAGNGVTWAANIQVGVTTGGAALPATVTLPADSLSSGASIPSLIVY